MFGYDWPRLHALLNDLPSALLVAAVFFDLVGTFRRHPGLRQAGFWTLILGAIGAVSAVISGLQAEERIAHGSAVHEIMERHEQLAFVTLAVFGALALWRLFRESRMDSGERTASLIVSLVGVGVLVATGRLGGRLVFEHAAGIPSEVLESELRQRSGGHHHGAGEDSAAGESPAALPASIGHDSSGHSHPAGTPAHTH